MQNTFLNLFKKYTTSHMINGTAYKVSKNISKYKLINYEKEKTQKNIFDIASTLNECDVTTVTIITYPHNRCYHIFQKLKL